MRNSSLTLIVGLGPLFLAGCVGSHSTIRYGRDGEQERFIECSGKPMSLCYQRALADCPQGYKLIEESQAPSGTKSGSFFGGVKNVGGVSGNTETTYKNQLIIRCKDASAPQGS